MATFGVMNRHLLLLAALFAAAITPSPALAQALPTPRSIDAPRARSPILIDGRLDEESWTDAPWTDDFVDIRGAAWPEPVWRTRAKLLWDDSYLYIAALLEEPHLWATLTSRDDIIYRDHDFEVFLDPDGDGLAYYELEINALGTEFDLFLDKPYSKGGKAHISWDMPGLRTAVHLDGTLNDASDVDRGWSVEIAIPWADVRPPGSASAHPPEAGDRWRVNFSRVQWPLEVVDGAYKKAAVPTPAERHPEHNWVWSPQGVVDMHVPEMWGVVRFVGRSRQ
jgi:hypothetical protein